jgi:hypothetical protein
MPATKQRQVYRLFNKYTLEDLRKRLNYEISYLDAIRRNPGEKTSDRFKEVARRILNEPLEELFSVEDELSY